MGTEDRIGDAEASERRARLLDLLAGEARPDGLIPFDRFMDRALYAENLGFYSRDPTPFGPTGSFYTAAHVSPLFASSVAARVLAIARAISTDRSFRVVELGPGDGTLAAGILEALGEQEDPADVDEYVLVDRSNPRRDAALAKAEAARAPRGPALRVASSVSAEGPFDGVVVANELLDAVPARRLKWDGQEWRELGVRREGTRLVPADGPRVDPVPAPELPNVPVGTVVEVSPAAEALVREVADHLDRGLLLLIDYGMEEGELVQGHPDGTLAAVRSHRSGEDPLAYPGETDLSVFVNFTRVRAAARSAGLREVAYTSLNEALGEWGFPALFDQALRSAESGEAEVRLRLAAKNLLFGFDRFRVLELASPAAFSAVARAT
jgi:SAM-dependent MidA family methyltransferase